MEFGYLLANLFLNFGYKVFCNRATLSLGQGCQFDFFSGQICDFWVSWTPLAFLFLEKGQMKLNFFWPIRFLYRFGRFEVDFGRFLGTVSGHWMLNFYWKLCTRIHNFCFAISQVCQFGFSEAKFEIFGFFSSPLTFFGQLDFLCPFGRLKVDFGRYLDTCAFLDTVLFLDTECWIFIGNSAREFTIFSFVFVHLRLVFR